jgi:hypothetical protein
MAQGGEWHVPWTGRHAPTGAGRSLWVEMALHVPWTGRHAAGHVASPGGFPMGRRGVPGRLRVGSSMFPGRDGMLPQVLDAACGWRWYRIIPGRDGMLPWVLDAGGG